MKHKTILYLRTDLGNQRLQAGGSVGHTMGVIRAYQDMGYRVIVASSALWPVLAKEQLHWYRLRLPFFCRWIGTKISAFCSSFLFLPRIFYLILRYKPVYIYQRYSLLNMSGVLASFITRVPLVLEYNGSEVWIEKHWTFKQKLRLVSLIKLVEWINLRYAHLVVVVSEVLHHDLVRRAVPAAKIITNPNGVDIVQFNPAILLKEREAIRTLLQIDSKIVVGFIGTFSAWHGINVLAHVIPLVVAHNKHIHFLLIGDGQLKEWVQKELHQYQAQVTYTGTVPQEQAKSYLAACDMFLCPTQPNADDTPFFGSPTKLFEYMSLAKPVIASAIEQVAHIIQPAFFIKDNELIEHQHAQGILVHSDDIDGFVQAILLVAQWSEQERMQVGMRAREKIMQEYTWNKHVEKIVAHPLLS